MTTGYPMLSGGTMWLAIVHTAKSAQEMALKSGYDSI